MTDANYLGTLIEQALGNAPDPAEALEAFGGARNFSGVLDSIARIERANSPVAGDGFLVKDELFTVKPGAGADYAAMNFSRLKDKWDNGIRPSIPGVALGWLDQIGVLESADGYQQSLNSAVLLAAARAEMVRGNVAPDAGRTANEPDYHSRLHFLHVLQASGHILETDDRMAASGDQAAARLDQRDKTLVLLAAIAHDLDHPGRGNPKDETTQKPVLYANEDDSFAIADKIFTACGLSESDRQTIKIMLRTTDPNGPHKFLKDAMKAHESGKSPITMSDIVPGEEARYADLAPLLADKKLCTMAAMLSDADLFGSAGAGMRVQLANSEKLSKEMRACGINMDFTTAASRAFFFRNIVGEAGFASAAGRKAFNDVFLYMADRTDRELRGSTQPARPVGPA